MPALYVGRYHASGFGDWIMMTAVLQMVNKYRPDVDIVLMTFPVDKLDCLTLPFLAGVKLRLVSGVEVDCSPATWVCPHLVYPAMRPLTDQHLIEGMVNQLNATCPGLNIPYDPDMRAVPLKVTPVPGLERDQYIVIPSEGKGARERNICSAKEWTGLPELAGLLRHHFKVVQVGSVGDPLIPNVAQCHFDLPLPQLSWLYRNAKFCISLENGLSHWAGHHDKRSYTLYVSDHHARPEHTMYPTQVPLLCRGLSPSMVANRILAIELIQDVL